MFGRDTFLGGLAFLVAFRTKVFLITEWPVPRSSQKSMGGVLGAELQARSSVTNLKSMREGEGVGGG